MRGAVEVEEPGGEVLIRGNMRQQAEIIMHLREFTFPWDGRWQFGSFGRVGAFVASASDQLALTTLPVMRDCTS